MAVNFVDANGNKPKARRATTGGATFGAGASEEDKARLLADLARRVADIEANRDPQAIEYEVNLPSSGVVVLEHNFGCPVRYYVTFWKESVAGAAPT